MITDGCRFEFAAAARTPRAVLALLALAVAAGRAQDAAPKRDALTFDGASTCATVHLDAAAFDGAVAWSLSIDVVSEGAYGPQTFLHAPGALWFGRRGGGLAIDVERDGRSERRWRAGDRRAERFVLVFDGARLRIAFDGGARLEVADLERPLPPPETLRVGARAPWRDVLHGEIPELALWSRALDDDEARRVARGDAVDAEPAQRWAGGPDAQGRWRDHGPLARHGTFTHERFRPVVTLDGYHGTWYANQRLESEYRWKYSGGLGTYCAKHIPHAIYAAAVDRTFFVYGGVRPGDPSLLHMVSDYDHATGRVPRPTLLLDKQTTDAHDNPVLALDDAGHLWVFSSSHGTARPSFVSRSVEPYSIERFEHVLTTNFSYPQPWHLGERGFLFLHTRYEPGRTLYESRSRDGRTWTAGRALARMEEGHYGISERGRDRVGLAFNLHPAGRGLNHRTNLYYLETRDGGETWTTAAGEPLALPLTDRASPALALDTAAQGELVYLKDLAFDERDRPAVLIVTSRGFEAGPANDPRTWRIVQWTGTRWTVTDVTTSDNHYDMGSLYRIDGRWVVLAPTTPGPQAGNPGGEVVQWREVDAGGAFLPTPLTAGSPRNHTYVRRPRPWHPGFQAFWADGHGRERSASRLYVLDGRTLEVRVLPEHMDGPFAVPGVLPRN